MVATAVAEAAALANLQGPAAANATTLVIARPPLALAFDDFLAVAEAVNEFLDSQGLRGTVQVSVCIWEGGGRGRTHVFCALVFRPLTTCPREEESLSPEERSPMAEPFVEHLPAKSITVPSNVTRSAPFGLYIWDLALMATFAHQQL